MAKQCRVAICKCNTGNFDTNDQTDDWYSQVQYDSSRYRQDQRNAAKRQGLGPTAAEQPKRKMRTNASKHTTRGGRQLDTTSNEDTHEIENERVVLEPIVHARKSWTHNWFHKA